MIYGGNEIVVHGVIGADVLPRVDRWEKEHGNASDVANPMNKQGT